MKILKSPREIDNFEIFYLLQVTLFIETFLGIKRKHSSSMERTF